ncbi:hypothetical protein [Belliella pelovolcani]|uniref:PH domain-containing protein n=1 Tax=Belliella pelovolcani TaxID=529505 RepID=A0A1N7LJR2_9BACT|nr:hypothetical protein [Belliella pelovolcani]SIS74053.1 hypothetical protein SAMN05421761_103392 [Belliella pelovolcani]
MKIYDRQSHKTSIFIFGLQIILGVFGLVNDITNLFSYVLIFLSLIGILAALYFKKFPYIEIADGEIIKQALFKNKSVKIADIKSFEKIENKLIIKTENKQIKISRDIVDVLEIRKFEEYIKNKINQ